MRKLRYYKDYEWIYVPSEVFKKFKSEIESILCLNSKDDAVNKSYEIFGSEHLEDLFDDCKYVLVMDTLKDALSICEEILNTKDLNGVDLMIEY